MSPVELIALSLGMSVAVAAIGGLTALGLERVSGDPALRERAWAAALYLPVLPPLAVGLMLLMPAPLAPLLEVPTLVAAVPSVETTPVVAVPVAEAFQMDWGLVVTGVLVLAALLVVARLVSLAWRAARLNWLVARAKPASDQARDAVAATARGLGVVAPSVRATDSGAEALLAGLVRPVLILPASLAETPGSPAARAVIAHEMAHLKRGDHRAVWVEEAVVALLAVNPLLPLIRARRAAAREEACDALALGEAEPAHRRAYAQSLIEALRARTERSPAVALPALTFTGTPRSQAMRRLKSILTPPATAGRGTKIVALFTGAGLLALVGLGSVAVAAQRETIAQAPASGDPFAEGVQRLANGSAADLRLFCAAPTNSRDSDLGCDIALWNAALAERQAPTGDFCAPGDDDAGLALISQRGRPQVLIGTDTQGSAQDGARRALIAAFPCNVTASQPSPSQLREAQAALSAEWSARHAARSATEAAAIAAGFRSQTVADIKRNCAAGGTDGAGCDGLIFGVVIRENMKPTAERTFCAPEAVADGPRLAERVKGAIVLTPAQGEEAVYPFLTRVLTGAYPCGTQVVGRLTAVSPLPNGTVRMEAEGLVATSDDAQANLPPARPGTTRLLVRLSYDDSTMVLSSRDRLRVGLEGLAEDGSRNVLSMTYDLEPGNRLPGLVWLDLSEGFFPKTNPAAYILTAQIDRGVDAPATFAANPATIRLAPMSQNQLGRLQPELTLRPVTSR